MTGYTSISPAFSTSMTESLEAPLASRPALCEGRIRNGRWRLCSSRLMESASSNSSRRAGPAVLSHRHGRSSAIDVRHDSNSIAVRSECRPFLSAANLRTAIRQFVKAHARCRYQGEAEGNALRDDRQIVTADLVPHTFESSAQLGRKCVQRAIR
jgi:hypothetical protein